jgi:hypothetical protein
MDVKPLSHLIPTRSKNHSKSSSEMDGYNCSTQVLSASVSGAFIATPYVSYNHI